jgi:nitroreductase
MMPKMEDNPVLHSLRSHRSIRRFTTEPLDDETLNFLIETAQRSSTSSNLQCYSVILVRDAEKKQKIAKDRGVVRQSEANHRLPGLPGALR